MHNIFSAITIFQKHVKWNFELEPCFPYCNVDLQSVYTVYPLNSKGTFTTADVGWECCDTDHWHLQAGYYLIQFIASFPVPLNK